VLLTNPLTRRYRNLATIAAAASLTVSLIDLRSNDEEHTEREEVKAYVKIRLEESANTLDRKTPFSTRYTLRQAIHDEFKKQRLQLKDDLSTTYNTLALSLDAWSQSSWFRF
jgi:hypothetical protein